MDTPDFETAWRLCPFCTAFGAMPPPPTPRAIGAAVMVLCDDAIDPDSVAQWADMVAEVSSEGTSFFLLATCRTTRDRAKAALATELERRNAARATRRAGA